MLREYRGPDGPRPLLDRWHVVCDYTTRLGADTSEVAYDEFCRTLTLYETGLTYNEVRRARDIVLKGLHTASGSYLLNPCFSLYQTYPYELATALAGHKVDFLGILAAMLFPVLNVGGNIEKLIREYFPHAHDQGRTQGDVIISLAKDLSYFAYNRKFGKESSRINEYVAVLKKRGRDPRVVLALLEHQRFLAAHIHEVASPKKRLEIAQASRVFFAPLALSLGFSYLARHLENQAFKVLHPFHYLALTHKLSTLRREWNIDAKIEQLMKDIDSLGIPFKFRGPREKTPYSLYEKRKHKKNICDYFGLMIVTGTQDDYESIYKHLLEKGYKFVPGSEDTVTKTGLKRRSGVLMIDGALLDFQMYDEGGFAEYMDGPHSAHWRYKLKQRKIQTEAFDLFLSQYNGDNYDRRKPDWLYYKTPRGDIISLPAGASVLDAAYFIHAEIGRHCSGALINGERCGYKTKLERTEGEGPPPVIELLCEKSVKREPEDLFCVVTPKAQKDLRKVTGLVPSRSGPKKAGEIGRGKVLKYVSKGL